MAANKTLGQQAYEAFMVAQGLPYNFNQLPLPVQNAWNAAAQMIYQKVKVG